MTYLAKYGILSVHHSSTNKLILCIYFHSNWWKLKEARLDPTQKEKKNNCAFVWIYLRVRGLQILIWLGCISLISSGFNDILHYLQLTGMWCGSPLKTLLVQIYSKSVSACTQFHKQLSRNHKHPVYISTLTLLSAAVSSSSSSCLESSWKWMTDTLFKLVSVGQVSSTLLSSRFSVKHFTNNCIMMHVLDSLCVVSASDSMGTNQLQSSL